MLGDASVHLGKSGASYRVNHGPKQARYCVAKYELLRDITLKPPSMVENRGYGKVTIRFWTTTSPALEFIRTTFFDGTLTKYGTPKKVITPQLLRELNWEAVAWWYMDDGTLQTRAMHFMTHSFSEKEVEMLAEWFVRNGVEAKVRPTRKGKKLFYMLVITTKGAEVLAPLIRPFMHPDLLYKVDIAPAAVWTATCPVCGKVRTKRTTYLHPRATCGAACARVKATEAVRRQDQKERYQKAKARDNATPEARARYLARAAKNNSRRQADPARHAALLEWKREWRKKRKAAGKPRM